MSSIVSDEDVMEFMQLMFYDTLDHVFKIICKVQNIPQAEAEELRRLVLRPNDIQVSIK